MLRAARKHLAKKYREKDRNSAAKRGYNRKWQKTSKRFLKKNPLCSECLKIGRTEPAVVVDHIEPHRGDMKKFWNKENWQGLCISHHNQKSAKEKG